MPYTRKEMRVGLKALNLGCLNLRSGHGQTLARWRRELIDAVGGPEKVTPTQIILINTTVRMRAYLDDIDTFLLSLPTVVNRKRRRVIPLVTQRQELSFHLVDALRQLGLQNMAIEKKPSAGFTVQDLIREAEQKRSAPAATAFNAATQPGAAERSARGSTQKTTSATNEAEQVSPHATDADVGHVDDHDAGGSNSEGRPC